MQMVCHTGRRSTTSRIEPKKGIFPMVALHASVSILDKTVITANPTIASIVILDETVITANPTIASIAILDETVITADPTIANVAILNETVITADPTITSIAVLDETVITVNPAVAVLVETAITTIANNHETTFSNPAVGDYVRVVYLEKWYPGLVEQRTAEEVLI